MGQLVMEHLQAENMGDLCKFSEKALQQLLGDKNGYTIDFCIHCLAGNTFLTF